MKSMAIIRRGSLMLLAAGSLALGASAQASVIPVTGGSVGVAFNVFDRGFNAQPATDPMAGATTDTGGTAPSLYYGTHTQEAGYVDFGLDYSSVRITGVFNLLHQWGHNTGSVPYQYAWSNDNTTTGFNDRATYYTPAPDFGFYNYAGATSDQQWFQVYSNPLGVTPLGRYLIVYYDVPSTSGLTTADRANEFVFVSNVPEPASLALMALGGLAMLSRERRGG